MSQSAETMKSYRAHFKLRQKFFEIEEAKKEAYLVARNAASEYSKIKDLIDEGWSRSVKEYKSLEKNAVITDRKFTAVEDRFFELLRSNDLEHDSYEAAHRIPGDVTATSWFKKVSKGRHRSRVIAEFARQAMEGITGAFMGCIYSINGEVTFEDLLNGDHPAMRAVCDVTTKLIETLIVKPKAGRDDNLKMKMCLVLIIRECVVGHKTDSELKDVCTEEDLEEFYEQISYFINVLVLKQTDDRITGYLSSKRHRIADAKMATDVAVKWQVEKKQFPVDLLPHVRSYI